MELAVGTETVFGPKGEGVDEVFVGDLRELAGLNEKRQEEDAYRFRHCCG